MKTFFPINPNAKQIAQNALKRFQFNACNFQENFGKLSRMFSAYNYSIIHLNKAALKIQQWFFKALIKRSNLNSYLNLIEPKYFIKPASKVDEARNKYKLTKKLLISETPDEITDLEKSNKSTISKKQKMVKMTKMLKIETSDKALLQSTLPTVPLPSVKNKYTKGDSPESQMGKRLATQLYKKISTSPFKNIDKKKIDYNNWNVVKIWSPNLSQIRNIWKPLLMKTKSSDFSIFNEKSKGNIKFPHIESNNQPENEPLLSKFLSSNNKYSSPIYRISNKINRNEMEKKQEKEIISEYIPSNSARNTYNVKKRIQDKSFMSSIKKDAQNIDSYFKLQSEIEKNSEEKANICLQTKISSLMKNESNKEYKESPSYLQRISSNLINPRLCSPEARSIQRAFKKYINGIEKKLISPPKTRSRFHKLQTNISYSKNKNNKKSIKMNEVTRDQFYTKELIPNGEIIKKKT